MKSLMHWTAQSALTSAIASVGVVDRACKFRKKTADRINNSFSVIELGQQNPRQYAALSVGVVVQYTRLQRHGGHQQRLA